MTRPLPGPRIKTPALLGEVRVAESAGEREWAHVKTETLGFPLKTASLPLYYLSSQSAPTGSLDMPASNGARSH